MNGFEIPQKLQKHHSTQIFYGRYLTWDVPLGSLRVHGLWGGLHTGSEHSRNTENPANGSTVWPEIVKNIYPKEKHSQFSIILSSLCIFSLKTLEKWIFRPQVCMKHGFITLYSLPPIYPTSQHPLMGPCSVLRTLPDLRTLLFKEGLSSTSTQNHWIRTCIWTRPSGDSYVHSS